MEASQEFSLPAPEPNDSEEVRQALESASKLWPEDPREALRCLRRAAEGAADAGDDLRSVQLARQAADLRTAANLAASMPPPAVGPVPIAPRALSQDPAQTVPATPAASAAAQTGGAQNGAAQNGAAQSGAAATGPARANDAASSVDASSAAEATPAAGVQADAALADTLQADTAQADAAQAAGLQADTAQLAALQADAAQAAGLQADAAAEGAQADALGISAQVDGAAETAPAQQVASSDDGDVDVATDDAAWDVRTSEDAGQGPVSSGRVEQETPQASLAFGGGVGAGAAVTEGAGLAASAGDGAATASGGGLAAEAQSSAPATLEQPAAWANGQADPRAELPTSPGATSELAEAAPGAAPTRVSGTYHAVASQAPETDQAGPQSGRGLGLGRFAATRASDGATAAAAGKFQGGLQSRLRAARAQIGAPTNGAAGGASAFRSGVHASGDGAAASSPPLAADSAHEPAPYSAPGRFVQHRAVRVSISPFPNASGHFELHPLAEGESPEPGWKVAVLVALDAQERLFPGRG